MKTDELNLLLYMPTGQINAPYLLANANLLYKEGEYRAAGTLFLEAAKTSQYAFCGYYGLGRCFSALFKFEAAVAAFEKSFALSKKPYIAIALVEALLSNGQREEAEKATLRFAIEFAGNSSACSQLESLYHTIISTQKNVVV